MPDRVLSGSEIEIELVRGTHPRAWLGRIARFADDIDSGSPVKSHGEIAQTVHVCPTSYLPNGNRRRRARDEFSILPTREGRGAVVLE